MPEQTTQERVIEFLADEFGIDDESTITPETRLDALGDSLDLAEFFYQVEEEFDIEILDEDTERMTTVGDLAAYIEKSPTV